MKAYLYTLLIGFVILCNSCSSEKQVDYADIQNSGQSDLSYTEIDLDSLKLDSINTSYIGEVSMFNNYLYFIDQKFCYVYKFDSNGKLIERFIGQGDGNDELPVKSIVYFTFMPNGNLFFLGPSWDCYIFDSNFKRINDYGVNWHADVTREQMAKKVDPSKTQIYSFLYAGAIKATDKKIIFPILSQHPLFNPTIEGYAKEARILGEMDVENGYMNKIYGRLSPSYINNFNSMVFCYPYFDIYDDEKLLLSFLADSLLHIADSEFNIVKSFGIPGRRMDITYSNVKEPQQFQYNWKRHLKEKGYYTFVKYIPEEKLIFRGYHKGGIEKTDGLQIYKEDTLIADVDVPIGFKVEGFKKPFFYSNAFVDPDKGEIKVYKFDLNK